MIYPDSVKTTVDRLAFCYAAQEKLRLAHNKVGSWYRDGSIDSASYDALPTTWRDSLSTASKETALTAQQWESFKKTYRDAESNILIALGEIKAAAMKDETLLALVDLDKVLASEVKYG